MFKISKYYKLGNTSLKSKYSSTVNDDYLSFRSHMMTYDLNILGFMQADPELTKKLSEVTNHFRANPKSKEKFVHELYHNRANYDISNPNNISNMINYIYDLHNETNK